MTPCASTRLRSRSSSSVTTALLALALVIAAAAGSTLHAQTPPAPAPAPEKPAEPAETAQEPPSQEPSSAAKRDKDAPVTVRGCLDNVMLMRVESTEEIPELTSMLRLLSKKDVKKQLKSMDRYEVEVTGRLKLPPKSPLRRKFGNTTVSVGVGDPRAPQNSPMYQQQMEFGTLDVTEARNLGTRCTARR